MGIEADHARKHGVAVYDMTHLGVEPPPFDGTPMSAKIAQVVDVLERTPLGEVTAEDDPREED